MLHQIKYYSVYLFVSSLSPNITTILWTCTFLLSLFDHSIWCFTSSISYQDTLRILPDHAWHIFWAPQVSQRGNQSQLRNECHQGRSLHLSDARRGNDGPAVVCCTGLYLHTIKQLCNYNIRWCLNHTDKSSQCLMQIFQNHICVPV